MYNRIWPPLEPNHPLIREKFFYCIEPHNPYYVFFSENSSQNKKFEFTPANEGKEGEIT